MQTPKAEKKAAQRQPSFGPVILISEEHDGNGKEDRRQIPRHCQRHPSVVVDLRGHSHPRKPQKSGESLLLQIIQRIMELHLPIIGTGAVQDDQADPNQDQHCHKQRIVITAVSSQNAPIKIHSLQLIYKFFEFISAFFRNF